MDRRNAFTFAGFVCRRFLRLEEAINVAKSDMPIPSAAAVAAGAKYLLMLRIMVIARDSVGIPRRPSVCAI